ncbi:metaxin-1 [Hyalella azteca]|uniref:Metaxin-1 n=1 Tax=Hyalella azteca TaxID=294128 RepID=A0A8B7PD31_HYAAZ|nr:metaxin-1 [Hyalella azteca]
MELHVWEGDSSYGLPSMDLESLQIMMYVKFSGAPVKIIKSMSPAHAPSRNLPVLSCPSGNLNKFSAITAHLRRKNFSCDHELTRKQCSDVLAYQQLIEEKLFPAFVYLWWVEPRSYQEIIHKWYYSRMRFPYKLWVPSNRHNAYKAFIESIVDEPDDEVAVETELLKRGQECLTLLSVRLGDKGFFFGSSPSSLDAILAPYLALLLKVDLRVPALQNHLRQCPNLTAYVSRALATCFPNENPSSIGYGRDKPRGPPPAEDGVNKTSLIFFTLAAALANFGYVFASGLVRVDSGDVSDDGEEYGLAEEEEEEQHE